MKLIPKKIENVRDNRFEGFLKIKPLVYFVVLTRTYKQVLVHILTPFTVCSSILQYYSFGIIILYNEVIMIYIFSLILLSN